VPPMTPHRAFVRHVPVGLALLAIGGGYALISERDLLGPRGLVPGAIVALAVVLLAAVRGGRPALGRSVGLVILGVVTAAEAVSTTVLVVDALTAPEPVSAMPQGTARALLRDAALVWAINVLTFALWYWELDGGGPTRRHHEGYRSADLVFPRPSPEPAAGEPWLPHFVDYLFLAFTASTAFGPTDTLIVSVRAKLLMMAQALISLTVLAIIAARAINTL
jgi:hypothetical protein